jgi:biotin synthase-like enzyme
LGNLPINGVCYIFVTDSGIIQGKEITYNEALQLLHVPDEEVLEVMNAAYLIRHHHYGKKSKA